MPHPSGVTPYAFHTTEPSPAGITDYGVDAAQNPYSYTTPIFQGTVSIRSLQTYLSGGGSSANMMTFQLNVVVQFTNGPNELDYWIQDVADVDTSVNQIGFLDNVWNLSSTSGQLGAADVSGNGTVNQLGSMTWYAAGASASLPGNLVDLAYPAVVSERVDSSDVAGFPRVAFEYNDGYGWVTYDNVTFHSARGYADQGFYVTGARYTPLGVFFDAEFDFTGPSAGGAAATDVRSDLNVSLDRWNGHNLQAVPNAYNFGSNTGELLQNFVSTRTESPLDGTLAGHEVNGSGNLGLLYDVRNVSDLNASVPSVPSGTLYINGTPHGYLGGDVNVTLGPGNYFVQLAGSAGIVTSLNVTLRPGQYVGIVLARPQYYVATFVAVGLPPGTAWSVTTAGVSQGGTSPTIAFNETNGTYPYSIGAVPGYAADAWAGTVTVLGGSEKTVNFSAFLYAVDFVSDNRPAGVFWTVAIGTQVANGSVGTLALNEPNGTYSFTVFTSNQFIVTPSSSTVDVAGSVAEASVAFSLRPGYLQGTIDPAAAVVQVDGAPVAASGGTFNLSLLPGTHAVEATADGYGAFFANESVTAGNATFLPIVLQPTPPGSPSTSDGSLPSWGLLGIALAVVAAVVIVAVAYVVSRRPPRP